MTAVVSRQVLKGKNKDVQYQESDAEDEEKDEIKPPRRKKKGKSLIDDVFYFIVSVVLDAIESFQNQVIKISLQMDLD